MGERNDASIRLKRWPPVAALQWNRTTKLICALVAITVYLPVAYWLKTSYVPPVVSEIEPKVAGTKLLLRRPFSRFLDSNFGVVTPDNLFGDFVDTVDNNERSAIEIYENDKRLGPAHSSHADIAKIGRGRFSHWKNGGAIFVFSSSDNSDPQTNGRAYWAVKPDIVDSPSNR